MKKILRRLIACVRSRSGTTLLECLIALVLFTAVMMMASSMLSSAGILSNRSKDLEDAVNSAVNLAETEDASDENDISLTFSGTGGSVTVQARELEVVGGAGDKEVTFWRLSSISSSAPGTT